MKPRDEDRRAVISRLRRVEGQIRGIQSMIEHGRDCDAVLTQYSATIGALRQAAYKYFAATAAECVRNPEAADEAGYTAERLEKLFTRIA
jgi:DNA-binding FrmR family transcriptional regulator